MNFAESNSTLKGEGKLGGNGTVTKVNGLMQLLALEWKQ